MLHDIYHQAGRARAYLSQRRRAHPMLFLAGAVIVGAAAVVAVAAGYRQYQQRTRYDTLLSALWSSYKANDWDANSGRTIDRGGNDVTTSEGQAYTMLRAVWMDDQIAFDRTWRWTADNIRRSDGLFSWRWGRRSDGSWGILYDQGGENTASDADTDIALALLMASAKWHVPGYADEARRTMNALWDTEVVMIAGRQYVGADNLEKNSIESSIVVNPSYLSPAAYHVFASVDTTHDWNGLAQQSYAFLQDVNHAPLDTGRSSGLTPEWVRVDRGTGAIIPPTNPGQTTQYGFNALRMPWRVGLDWQWYRDGQAKQMLTDYALLARDWQNFHKLSAMYTHDGKPAADYESLALYGGSLGYFSIEDTGAARQIVQDKLAPRYNPVTSSLTKPLSYYDNNWTWLGIAFVSGKLPNLAAKGGSA